MFMSFFLALPWKMKKEASCEEESEFGKGGKNFFFFSATTTFSVWSVCVVRPRHAHHTYADETHITTTTKP
jgi:hypothetical protein